MNRAADFARNTLPAQRRDNLWVNNCLVFFLSPGDSLVFEDTVSTVKKTSIEVRGWLIRTPTGAQVRPLITHAAVYPTSIDFADLEAALAEAIEHHVNLFIDREMIDDEGTWDSLSCIVPATLAEQFHAGRFLVGKFAMLEFPVSVHDEANISWLEWLDQTDAETAHAGFIAEALAERTTALLDGSLFYLRRLYVSSHFAGQMLGGRLMGHALWHMRRACGDVAIMHAWPMDNTITGEKADVSVSSVRRLVRYYERLGFSRAKKGRIDWEQPVPMLTRFGEFRMPIIPQ